MRTWTQINSESQSSLVRPYDLESPELDIFVWFETISPDSQRVRNRLRLDSESTTLLTGEPKSLPAELLAQCSIFLLQILDHLLLVAVNPSGEDQHQKLKDSVFICQSLGQPSPKEWAENADPAHA